MVVNKEKYLNGEKFKHYPRELKERAIDLAEEIGTTRAARILGVMPAVVRNWQNSKRDGKRMSNNDSPEVKELILARREIQKLKRENNDLKKANLILKDLASVFSKDPLNTNLGRSLNSTNKENQR